jgi:hypothetical protein
MTITIDQLTTYYPRLYHMAEKGIWPSIERHGLLSTTALLDLFEINGDLRRRIETEHRPQSVTITHPKHGNATIRDQKPMREGPLRECLQGMTPRQWYSMLNGRVFFWVTEDRVQTLLNAKAYRDHIHTVVTVETRSLLKKYASVIALSPINSGSTIYNPRPRGPETFRSLADYPFEERRKLRGVANAVAEEAVGYAVLDLRDFVIRVEHRKGSRIVEILYK